MKKTLIRNPRAKGDMVKYLLFDQQSKKQKYSISDDMNRENQQILTFEKLDSVKALVFCLKTLS